MVAQRPQAHRAAQERHLLLEVAAAPADREVNAQPQALAEAQAPIQALGHQPRHFLAREHHLPNQFVSRHCRSAMRAR